MVLLTNLISMSSAFVFATSPFRSILRCRFWNVLATLNTTKKQTMKHASNSLLVAMTYID